MSYQFEDDSALEELLNQQLDRRKQQPKPSQVQPTGGRPSTAVTVPPVHQPSRPSNMSASNISNRKSSLSNDEQPSKSKLSSWLAGKGQVDTKLDLKADDTSLVSSSNRLPPISSTFKSKPQSLDQIEIDFSLFDEDKLQEMSKQRLIQLIMNQIQDLVKNLHAETSTHSTNQVEQLKAELDVERRRLQSLEATQLDKIKLEEQKWTQINEQLEKRLDFSERELTRLIDGQREHLLKIDEQHEKDLHKLVEYYELKLKNDREQFDELLRRRNEIHQIEMDSRLRVDCNLNKLDTIQSEWNKSIETTISQLENHFKSVETLLDKQTIQVKGTNLSLLEKTEHLNSHYGKFEQCNNKVSELADCMSSLMPKITRLQEQNESIHEATRNKLDEFNKRSDLLSKKEEDIERLKFELVAAKEKLNEDRLRLALDMNRVELKEKNLDESMQTNRDLQAELEAQKSEQSERDIQLRSMGSNLDTKANELREQNYDLHLARKRLTSQKDELAKSQSELELKKRSMEEQSGKLEANMKRLHLLRAQVNRELDQLGRLQKSLICSLCLSRLFSPSHEVATKKDNHRRSAVVGHPGGSIELDDDSGEDAMFGQQTIGRLNPRTGSISQLEASRLPLQLEAFKDQAEKDKRRLVGESRFVKIISTTN